MEIESDTSELTSLGNAHEAEDFVIIESIGKWQDGPSYEIWY